MGGMSEIAESKQEKSVHQRPLLLFPWEQYSTSAFQASSLGLYYTLLKIHVSNVSKTCSCHTVLSHHSLYFRRGQTCLWLHQGVSTIQEVNPKHSIMISGGSNPPGDCPVLAQQLGLLLPGAAVMLRAKAVMIINHR